jgi:xeroderma pigmentosum group C-complementing protein
MTDPSARVEQAASSNVDGYLRNALRRVRAPAEEGGRGTRRRLEMVTSLNVAATSAVPFAPPKEQDAADDVKMAATSVVVDDDGDEWDVVTISTNTAPSKPKHEVEVGTDDHHSSDATSLCEHGMMLKDPVDGEHADAAIHQEQQSTKVEVKWAVKHEDNADLVNNGSRPGGQVSNAAPPPLDQPEGDGFEMQWARPTLTSIGTSNHQTSVGQHRAITREMEEEREAAKASEKSSRILRVAARVTDLLVIIQRFVRVMRESHHPLLWKCLLRIPMLTAAADVDARQGGGGRLFIEAIKFAKEKMAAAKQRPPAPTLAPCWVTSKSDTVKNDTSSAIVELLRALKQVTCIVEPAPDNVVGQADDHRVTAEAPLGTQRRFHPLEPFQPGILLNALKRLSRRRRSASVSSGPAPKGPSTREAFPSPIYMCMLLLMECHLASMDARLVIAWDAYPPQTNPEPDAASGGADNDEGAAAAPAARKGRGQKLMTTVAPKESKSRRSTSNAPKSNGASEGGADGDGAAVKPPPLPESYCWCEVWCPIRQSWISVNPCAESVRVAWDYPYILAFGRGGVVVDVSPRYTSKFSALLGRQLDAKEHLSKSYLWRRIPKDDTQSYLSVLLKGRLPTERFPTSLVAQHQWTEREKVQLDKLIYAEPVPNTLGALKRHPLYVLEQDIGRWEGIYPKDATTTVGSVRGLVVYKRTAVVSLRSRDGWLRMHRSLKGGDEQAYKVVPPPPSRPFAPSSNFFGRWQTVPFEPRPLRDDGSIEKHGNSTWYILLRGSQPPHGITHLNEPQISRVARKMKVDFANAVVAFVKRHASGLNRRGTWDAQIEGIVVPTPKAAAVAHAYAQWVEMTAQELAAKRRQRAMKWWAHLIQQRLAMHRLESLYEEGEERRRKRHRVRDA